MTGRKSKSPGPKASKAKTGTSRVRKTAVAKKRAKTAASSSPRSTKAAAPARKADATPSPRKAAARAQAAAPLLARAEKKVGPAEKTPPAAKPSTQASYHPKTEPPAAPANVHAGRPAAAFDFLGLAQPWMTLGWRMTTTGLAMQARMAKAALDMPLATTAMRQSADAWNAWFALVQRRTTKPRKD
jgi:hypothetical protein